MKAVEVRFAAETDAEALLEIYAPYVWETAITFELEEMCIRDSLHRGC